MWLMVRFAIIFYISILWATSALVVLADGDNATHRSVRNLKTVKSLTAESFSVYEAVKYENLIIEKKALETLIKRLV